MPTNLSWLVRAAIAAALLGTHVGCVGALNDLVVASRDDFVEATSEDAATLSLMSTSEDAPLLTGVTEPATCKGTVNLGRPYELTAPRTFRLQPGKEFGFLIEGRRWTEQCHLLTIFTPAPRGVYRAELAVTDHGCTAKLLRVNDGQQYAEPTRRTRKTKGFKDGKLVCP